MKANEPKKPDFMINPHKYFRDKNSPAGAEFKGVNKSTTESIIKPFYVFFFLIFKNNSFFMEFFLILKIQNMHLMRSRCFLSLVLTRNDFFFSWLLYYIKGFLVLVIFLNELSQTLLINYKKTCRI